MEKDDLRKIEEWASHGTLRQFYAEVSAKLSKEEKYQVELEGDSLVCYRVHSEGGFLGIGKHQVKDPVLKIIRKGDETIIPDDSADEAFVKELASLLRVH